MKNSITILVLSLLFCARSIAQVSPNERQALNYRIIGFRFQTYPNAISYTLEIAEGDHDSDSAFIKHKIITRTTTANKQTIEVPAWGAQYTWKYTANTGTSNSQQSTYYHFSTGSIPNTDTAMYRLRITTPAKKHTDAYVFADENKTIYDMNGRAIWFLPQQLWEQPRSKNEVIDLKISPFGTITFIANGQPYEVDYNGKVLWTKTDIDRTAKGGSANYHHEFTRLNNGNYMTMITEHLWWRLPGISDSMANNPGDSTLGYQQLEFGAINEYDKGGNIVWQWHSADYFKKSDLYKRRSKDGKFDIYVHLNTFFFDEKKKVVYAGFRDVSRIVQIQYPGGKVTATYGKKYTPEDKNLDNYLFCRQHSCSISPEGYLCIFNNNICGKPSTPKLVMMKAAGNELKKIWEYECDLGKMKGEKKEEYQFARGGNMIVLAGGTVFGSLNIPFSKIFIIDKNKNELWCGLPEKWDTTANRWIAQSLYKASIITDKAALEKLIWSADQN